MNKHKAKATGGYSSSGGYVYKPGGYRQPFKDGDEYFMSGTQLDEFDAANADIKDDNKFYEWWLKFKSSHYLVPRYKGPARLGPVEFSGTSKSYTDWDDELDFDSANRLYSFGRF